MKEKTYCVVIETPLRGDYVKNQKYARLAMLDSLLRGESPFLGHLLYTQVLKDGDSDQRERGIHAHFDWITKADYLAIYIDLGISEGMKRGMAIAAGLGLPIVDRHLSPNVVEILAGSDLEVEEYVNLLLLRKD